MSILLATPLVPLAVADEGKIIWQIGQKDQSYRDLAFDGDLNSYADAFPNDVTFAVGESTPARDFSGHHPGARDKWAGRREHPFLIRFDMPARPVGLYLLTIDLVDTAAQWPPTYRVAVNGTAVERVLDAGTGEIALLRPAKGKSQSLRYVIASDQLQPGANTVELCSPRGSWLVYDALSLKQLPADAEIAIACRVKSSVFFVEQAGELLQEFVISADGIGNRRNATVQVRGGASEVGTFPLEVSSLGTIEQAVHLPPATQDRELSFTIRAGKQSFSVSLVQTPQKKWRIYVAPTVHVDIGYNYLQREAFNIHNRNTTYAMELADAFEGFFFNSECAWPVVNWLGDQPGRQREALYEDLRRKRLGVGPLYLNMLTGLCTDEELIRNLYPASRMNRDHGVPLTTAMLTDAPSHVWSLPSLLAGAGIRYLSVGVNDVRAPLFSQNIHHKNPFWWEGPDGQRVLTWFAVGYGFNQSSRLGIRPEIGRMEVSIEKEMAWWAERDDYPYDAIYFHGVYGDNQLLSRNLPEKVADYNRRYAYPKLILAGPDAFFSYIEENFSEHIPTLRGCGGSWWEDGAASSAYETALNRNAHQAIITAEKVWAAARGLAGDGVFPSRAFDTAWKNILLFDEHTWGANVSITDPTSDFVQRQWGVKAGFALDAADQTRDLLERGLRRLAARVDVPGDSLLVFNPAGQSRTGLVRARIPRDVNILDDKTLVTFQVVDESDPRDREVMFVACDVPATGYRTYTLRPTPSNVMPPIRFDGEVLENEFYRITFDLKTGGIVSLFDKAIGVEIVDQASPYQFSQFVYAAGGYDPALLEYSVPNPELVRRSSPDDAAVALCAQGPVFTSVMSRSGLPGFGEIAIETRLYESVRRVDFLYHIDKTMTFEKEAVYFAFPVAGANPQFRYEVGGASVRPNVDQLPGACRDWFAVQRWVTVNTDDVGIAWVPIDTPLATFCDMHPGKWLTELPITNGTVFAYAMNNYWFTNYKAGQDGKFLLRYSLTSDRAVTPASASVFGESVVAPMQTYHMARKSGRSDLPRVKSFCRVEPATVTLVACKMADDGKGIIVRIRETAGEDTPVRIQADFTGATKASTCDLLERRQGPIEMNNSQVTLNLKANAMATIRLE